MDQSESTAAKPVRRSRMATRRRWLQFSLRGFLVVLTAFAVWLGVIVNRAREQREAIMAIEALGGTVRFDWQAEVDLWTYSGDDRYYLKLSDSTEAQWLRELSQTVTEVYFLKGGPNSDSGWQEAIQHLQQLHGLRTVRLFHLSALTGPRWEELKAALPNCNVR